jgi:hypothetical protein
VVASLFCRIARRVRARLFTLIRLGGRRAVVPQMPQNDHGFNHRGRARNDHTNSKIDSIRLIALNESKSVHQIQSRNSTHPATNPPRPSRIGHPIHRRLRLRSSRPFLHRPHRHHQHQRKRLLLPSESRSPFRHASSHPNPGSQFRRNRPPIPLSNSMDGTNGKRRHSRCRASSPRSKLALIAPRHPPRANVYPVLSSRGGCFRPSHISAPWNSAIPFAPKCTPACTLADAFAVAVAVVIAVAGAPLDYPKIRSAAP